MYHNKDSLFIYQFVHAGTNNVIHSMWQRFTVNNGACLNAQYSDDQFQQKYGHVLHQLKGKTLKLLKIKRIY